MKFKELESKPDFPKIEEDILDLWKTKSIFQKSLEQREDSPEYSFYDGPPFATGLPHHGHLIQGTIKDIIPRYFTMKGYSFGLCVTIMLVLYLEEDIYIIFSNL